MKKILRENYLIAGIIVAVIAGCLFGSLFPKAGVALGFLGETFLNALKMIVIPLIIVSITLSIMKIGNLGSLGLKTLIYFLSTTGAAVLIGIIVVVVVHPGDGSAVVSGQVPEIITGKESIDLVDTLVTHLISANLFSSAAEFDVLPLIIASILFGAAFAGLGKDKKLLVDVFTLFDRGIMKVVHWIMLFTPLGIFSLIAERIGLAGGGSEVANLAMQIGKYVFAVILGLFIHGVIVLPAILYFLGKRSPFEYVPKLSKALLTAFSTASSSATIPVTMEGVINEAKVSPRIGRFVVPLGATINMDGTALYEAVAVIFIAQSYGIELGMAEMVIIFFTATLSSMGAAGIPEAGLVTMVIVLNAVGLPVEGIGLLLAVDWLLDRFRTTVNVWGDCVAAVVIEYSEKGKPVPEEEGIA